MKLEVLELTEEGHLACPSVRQELRNRHSIYVHGRC